MSGLLDPRRSTLLAGLRDALDAPSSLAALVRRHVGIEDDAGRPTDAAGKLLRPSLVLFVAHELAGKAATALPAAVAVELMHNFSLVHDDIQDQDRLRRGRPTLWTVCGEAQAINAGDLLHAVAFREAARCGAAAVTCLAEATIEMMEGQSLDLAYEERFVSIEEYMEMIRRKTGALLGCACELGGLTAAAGGDVRARLRDVGTALGRAFQIRDDALGIWGDESFGKPRGSDIRRRKKSFPVVWTTARAQAGDRARLEAIYARDPVTEADASWVVGLMEKLGAPQAADAAVRRETDAALCIFETLPISPRGRADLGELVEALAGRRR